MAEQDAVIIIARDYLDLFIDRGHSEHKGIDAMTTRSEDKMTPTFYDSSPVPNAEIEAAADALRTLWESEENQKYLRETGFGASYLYPAQVALEAALKVRGRTVSEPPTASQ